MKKNKKLIDLYKEWMETGRLDTDGICNSIAGTKYYKYLDLVEPTDDDLDKFSRNYSRIYWAYGRSREVGNTEDKYFKFTPLRQTIVLLICAIHSEL